MDGPQNMLQGSAGFGEIPGKDQPESEPWPADQHDWEPTMASIYAAMVVFHQDVTNLDMLRWYRETFEPRDYWNMSYFELWLQAVAHVVADAKLGGITEEDLIARKIVTRYQLDQARLITARGKLQAVLGFGRPNASGEYSSPDYKEDVANPPKYSAGQKVRGRQQRSAGHTRQYDFVRSRPGVIDRIYPVRVVPKGGSTGSGKYEAEYPDLRSKGRQSYFIPVYSVRYRAQDVWGTGFAERNTVIYSDQYEPYLEPQEPAQ